jgi:3'-5' exoribonuclease
MQIIERKKQIESCLDYLQKEINNIENNDLRDIAQLVIDNQRFIICTGSKEKHHSYQGGLVVHTSEVMENGLLLCESQSLDIDQDALRVAIVYHDYGKIYDYVKNIDGSYEYTEHNVLIRHLARSYAEFMSVSINIDEKTRNKIGHIILAHHSRKLWGSPVEPVLPEAFIIHAADHISAQCAKDYYVRR